METYKHIPIASLFSKTTLNFLIHQHTFHSLLLSMNVIFLKLLKAFFYPMDLGVKIFIYLVVGLRRLGVCCSAFSNSSRCREMDYAW